MIQILDSNDIIEETYEFLGCAAILAAAQPLKIVFVVVVVVVVVLCCCSQINFYTRSFDIET